MTVHKSQGSQFTTVILILPLYSSPLLSRQLLYTAVTRATSAVEIWGSETLLAAAIKSPARRISGLADALQS